ncbi:MAG TPA: alternative ribosome rescue aminoacyl-tRNA hydrolase ArfB [Gammaproteobacteria bacterium]
MTVRYSASSSRAGGLRISNDIEIPDAELDFTAIRAQGAGGQNVNKVSSAMHLRFDVTASKALPNACKERLLRLRDHRISIDGVVVIKAQQHRSQDKNKAAALERLCELIQRALATPKPRKPTKPTRASQAKRLDSKTRRSRLKRARAKIDK